jgi:glycosyltransferase involved in cell wall biosynthesis
MFSPYPGKGSGIADYAARLAGAMTPALAVDLYHDHDYVPESQFKASRFPCHDYRLYPMMAARASYRGVIHHMGNSWYHKFIYEAILRNPGIVVLHDLHLAGFHWWYGSLAGAEHDHFIAELERDDPAGITRWSGELEAWKREEGGIQGAAARRGLYVSRSVLERASRLVVHSSWARNALARRHPDLAGKVVEVPLGAEGFEPSPGMRTETRRRFGLSADGLVIGCFGILTRNKMDEELLEAFASAGPELEGATLVFAGKDWEEGAARRKAEGLGLGSRVRFLGRVDGGDYEALLGAVDLAVSLRRPPTFGESSASLLDCLRAGIPTIINDAGTLAEVPQGVTWKIRWEAEGVAGLAGAIRVLAGDPGRRAALGAAARQHVERKHNWRRVAGLYEQLIEEEWGRNQRARAAG